MFDLRDTVIYRPTPFIEIAATVIGRTWGTKPTLDLREDFTGAQHLSVSSDKVSRAGDVEGGQ